MAGGEITEDQDPLVAWLQTPGVLAATAPEVIETHGAFVFLAGDRAYKLKRAIRYDFMDFGTLAKRTAASRAELALNRRTAPELYLGLRPVYRDGESGGFELGPMGDAPEAHPALAEHLIVMRRFDAAATFDRLAVQGALTGVDIDRLAHAIARFHLAATPDPERGAAERLATVSRRTMNVILAGGAVLGDTTAASLDRQMLTALRETAGEVEARGQAGYIRRLHGDLHLGNVAMIDGRPVIFDALEFNDAMATVDVLHDAAFLVMDLWEKGAGELAARAWSRYLAEMDDYAGLTLGPLFVSMRAAVRAKVALSTADLATGAAKAAHEAEARAYADATARALARPETRLVAVGGLSGSGKTTLARSFAADLAPATGAVHLRSDALRKHLAGVAFEDRLPAGAYTREASAAVYAGLLERAEQVLRQGVPVILDAVYAEPAERIAVAELAARLGAPFQGFWLDLPLAARQQRIAGRADDASDATAAVAAKQADYDIGRMDWARIDAGADAAAAARRVLGL